MPIVNVKVIENVFTKEQKAQIIRKLTDAMIEIEGENMRGVTWVYIEDIKEGELGIGGQPLTAADVHQLQKGENAA
jgi:4-oxalocrotonate tautomerase